MVNCAVPGCKTKKDRCPGLTWHSFPKDIARRRKWGVAIGREEGPSFKITPWTRVCSRHFIQNDFKNDCSRRSLKAYATPSRFEWNSWGDDLQDKPVGPHLSLSIRKQNPEIKCVVMNTLPNHKESMVTECFQCAKYRHLIVSLQERNENQEKELQMKDDEINRLQMERLGLLARLSNDMAIEIARVDNQNTKPLLDKAEPVLSAYSTKRRYSLLKHQNQD